MWQRSASCSPDFSPAWAWCRTGEWGYSFRRANHETTAFRAAAPNERARPQGTLTPPLLTALISEVAAARHSTAFLLHLHLVVHYQPSDLGACSGLAQVRDLYVTTDGGLEAWWWFVANGRATQEHEKRCDDRSQFTVHQPDEHISLSLSLSPACAAVRINVGRLQLFSPKRPRLPAA